MNILTSAEMSANNNMLLSSVNIGNQFLIYGKNVMISIIVYVHAFILMITELSDP